MSIYDSPDAEIGSWGEFFASIEGATIRLQESRLTGFDQADKELNKVSTAINDDYVAVVELLNQHMATHQNQDHKLDKVSINLGLVDNFKTAVTITQENENSSDEFLTPSSFNELGTRVFADFADKIHHQEINPISVYGDLSWMPPDVYGSFEGSGMRSGAAMSQALIEDDGTYIGLRYGTNGTSQGLYYYYQTAAEDRVDSESIVRTNTRYTPANAPSGLICVDVSVSDVSCILGMTAGHPTLNGFIALTNGTMDVSKHYVGYFRYDDEWSPTCQPYWRTACVAGNYVYGFYIENHSSWTPGEIDNPFTVAVVRCPVSAVVGGGVVQWEHVTNWSTRNLWGNQINANEIQLANCLRSTNRSKQPYLLYDGEHWLQALNTIHSGVRLSAVPNPVNPNQIRLLIQHTIWCQLDNGAGSMPTFGFSVTVDVNAKTAVCDDDARYIHNSSPNSNTISWDAPTMIDPRQITGYPYGGNYWPSVLVTERGYILARGGGNQPEENTMYFRSKIENFVNRFDAQRIGKRHVRPITALNDLMRVGSEFTNGVMNPRYMTGGYLIYNATATKQRQFAYGSVKRLQFLGEPNFTYGTINSGSLQGWAPNGTRIEFPRLTFNQCVFITRVYANGSVACDASVAHGDGNGVSGTTIDKDLIITGQFSYDKTELYNIARTAASTAFGTSASLNVTWTMYVPQDNTIPVLMVITATTPRPAGDGRYGTALLVELNYNGPRSGHITGVSFKRICNRRNWDKVPGSTYEQYETMCGIQAYQCSDGTWLLGIGSPSVLQVYGGQDGACWYAAVRSGSRTIEDGTVRGYNHSYYPTSTLPSPFVHPGYGLCMMDYGTNQANYNAVLVVNVMANSYADYQRWSGKQKLVIGAQEVEKGWIVYFTADTPVFLAGREYILKATSIDLRTIDSNPGNKTFYVYVRLTEDGIKYWISSVSLAPTMTMMYIGKITTIASQISTFQIAKKIRVDTFELSPVHIGSGIPISTGVPSSHGNYAWFSRLITSVDFLQYDTSGALQQPNNNFQIGFIDIRMNLKAAIVGARIEVTDLEDHVANEGDRFTYCETAVGTYSNSIVIHRDTINPGDTVRVYVKVLDNNTISKRVTSMIQATIVHGFNRTVRRSQTFGYNLAGIASADVGYIAYDTAGTEKGWSNDYQIGSIDLVLQPGMNQNGVVVEVSDAESVGNGGAYYTYSTAANGSFNKTLSFTKDVVNGTTRQRIYVKVNDDHSSSKRVTSVLKVTTRYQNGTSRSTQSPLYGYALVAVNDPDVTFVPFDTGGGERDWSNNYQIGSIDLVFQPGPTMPGTQVTVSDVEGANGGVFFNYSLNQGGPFTKTVSFNRSVAQGERQRIYVQVYDPKNVTKRVTSQLRVDTRYSNGLTRQVTSSVYGYSLVARPVFNNRPIADFAVETDKWFDVSINLTNGAIVMTTAGNEGNYSSSTCTDLVNGGNWDPSFNYYGPSTPGVSNRYWKTTFSGCAIPGIQQAASVTAVITKTSGDGSTWLGQPSSGNGYTITGGSRGGVNGVKLHRIRYSLSITW